MSVFFANNNPRRYKILLESLIFHSFYRYSAVNLMTVASVILMQVLVLCNRSLTHAKRLSKSSYAASGGTRIVLLHCVLIINHGRTNK